MDDIANHENSLLAGLRVLDVSSGLSGAWASQVLADQGADVLMVEPLGGHPLRARRGFATWARGKRTVVVDDDRAESREALVSVAAACDVVIDDETSPARGFDYARLERINPGVVYCSLSAFGPFAGLTDLPMDEGIFTAKAGLMLGRDRLSGANEANEARSAPVFTAAPVFLFGTGQLAVQGILAALIRRASTGRGQLVQTSMLEAACAMVMREGFMRSGDDVRSGPASATVYAGIGLCFLTAQCSDDKWIQMCARQDQHFRNWVTLLGLDWIFDEPRWVKAPLGIEQMEDIKELEQLLRKRMRQRPQADWMRAFIEDSDVGADPFLSFDEFIEHPQMLSNGRVLALAGPEGNPTTQPGEMIATAGRATSFSPAPVAGHLNGCGTWRASARFAPPQREGRPGAKPLSGLTVLEIAYFIAGPLGTTLLAEMGARVIKLEPLAGDPWRRSGRPEFALGSYGKQSIAADLKSPEGQEILRRLILESDALLHNFRPGVPERLGMDYATVHALNPRLAYVYAASYGSSGPEARRAAFHSTPNALSGAGIIQSGLGNPPVDDSWPDPCGGLVAGTALSLGLLHTLTRADGNYMETSMLATAGHVMSEHLTFFDGAQPVAVPDRAQRGLGPLQQLYRCATGWLFLSVLTETQWRSLVDTMECADLHADRLGSPQSPASDAELTARLAGLFERRSAQHWEVLLRAAGVPAVQADAHRFPGFMRDVGALSPLDHEYYGPLWHLPPKVRFSDTSTELLPPPGLGEHTRAILADLGYDQDAISTMVDREVVGCS
jgi:crotonobetainyl-CoA:carnitine CoA-transferase CaiB-like acyl-CoA transferase